MNARLPSAKATSEAAAVAGEAEGDALVVGEGEAERAEDVDVLARVEVGLDHRLGDLVEGDDEAAERAGEAPGARALHAHPEIRPTTTARTTKRTMIAMIGLRSSANPRRRRSAAGCAGRG